MTLIRTYFVCILLRGQKGFPPNCIFFPFLRFNCAFDFSAVCLTKVNFLYIVVQFLKQLAKKWPMPPREWIFFKSRYATLLIFVPVNLTVAQGKNCKNLDQGASQNSQMRAKTAKCNPKWPQSCGYGGLGVVMVVLVVVVVVLWSSEIGDFVYAPVYLIFSRLS